jgi:MFS family permease
MSNDLQRTFFGWRVVAGAFVIAVLGWGLGFYGPPVYLHAVREARGWSVGFVSAAVTLHFVSGALVVANLPRLYARFGLRTVTRCGVALLALGLVGWAVALAQWQLLIATLFTGAGWVTLGAAAINAMVSPWFVRDRPKALSTAYNGASVGGIIFSPLWVVLIEGLGFATAAAIVGLVAFLAVWWLTASVVATRPEDLGQFADGLAAAPETAKPVLAGADRAHRPSLLADRAGARRQGRRIAGRSRHGFCHRGAHRLRLADAALRRSAHCRRAQLRHPDWRNRAPDRR